jgi:hypothetical protein
MRKHDAGRYMFCLTPPPESEKCQGFADGIPRTWALYAARPSL